MPILRLWQYPARVEPVLPLEERVSPDKFLPNETPVIRRINTFAVVAALTAVAFVPVVEPRADTWLPASNQPVQTLRKQPILDTSFFTALPEAKPIAWYQALSEPVRARAKPVVETSFFVPINVPDLDSWAKQIANPVFREQQLTPEPISSFVPVVTATPSVTVDSWSQPLSTVPRGTYSRQQPDSSAFVPLTYHVINVDKWAQPLSTAPLPRRAALWDATEFVPVVSAVAPTIYADSWYQELSTPITKRPVAVSEQAFVPLFTPALDTWHQALSTPVYTRPGSPRELLAFVPIHVPKIDTWQQPLSTPVWVKARNHHLGPCEFSHHRPIVSFAWHEAVSVPVRRIPPVQRLDNTQPLLPITNEIVPPMSSWYQELSVPRQKWAKGAGVLSVYSTFTAQALIPITPTPGGTARYLALMGVGS